MDTPRLLLEALSEATALAYHGAGVPQTGRKQCAKEGATFEQFLLRLSRTRDAGPGARAHRASDPRGQVSRE